MDLATFQVSREAPFSTILRAWDYPEVEHGFTSRLGGVSRGPFASFNLARWVGDDPAAVKENWRRWHSAMPSMTAAHLNQTHGKRMHTIEQAANAGRRGEGDGMVTAAAGVALCVFSADCVPVLMLDRERHVAAALHAGWRGTLSNIAAEGISAMAALGARASQVQVALGPSIGLCCFEVDRDLADRFEREYLLPPETRHAGREGKAYLDLRVIIRRQLESAGVAPGWIRTIGPCTRCANDRFFSRRAVGGAISGLQMSFIGFAT